jgi:pilus assembly protein Flp/PilA
MNALKKFIQEDDGVTAIEYALIAALIAAVLAAGATTLGSDISTFFTNMAAKIKA